jgi:hypothetical protein
MHVRRPPLSICFTLAFPMVFGCQADPPRSPGQSQVTTATSAHKPVKRNQSPEGIVVRVCGVPQVTQDGINKTWNTALMLAMKLMMLTYSDLPKTSLQFEETCSRKDANSCSGFRGEVECGEDTLSRVVHASALSAAQYWIGLGIESLAGGKAKAEALPFGANVAVVDSLHKGNGRPNWLDAPPRTWNTASVEVYRQSIAAAEAIRTAMLHENVIGATDNPLGNLTILATHSFTVAMTETLGFILGHEFGHANGRCALPSPSVLEQDGTFGRAIAASIALGDSTLDASELAADRCAFRALEEMDNFVAGTTKRVVGPAVGDENALWTLAIGRRIAIEAIGWVVGAGLADRTSYVTQERDRLALGTPFASHRGYLNQSLRQFLAAALLHRREEFAPKQVRLCGREAIQFVLLVEHAAQVNWGSDDKMTASGYAMVSELVGEVLPRGAHERLRSNEHVYTPELPRTSCGD